MSDLVHVNAVTLAEIDLRRAQLTERAERLRERQAAIAFTSSAARTLAREVRHVQRRADDYAAILRLLKQSAA